MGDIIGKITGIEESLEIFDKTETPNGNFCLSNEEKIEEKLLSLKNNAKKCFLFLAISISIFALDIFKIINTHKIYDLTLVLFAYFLGKTKGLTEMRKELFFS